MLDDRITDADARAYLASLPASSPRAGLTAAEIRARPRVPLRVDPDTYAVAVDDVEVLGMGARRYTPRIAPAAATMVYLHGGGWALGDLDINDDVCRYLADRSGVTLLSLDYPLAPEHPFPAALDAATELTRAVATGATRLRDLPDRVLVGGLSAGAALAAAVAARGVDGRAPRSAALVMLSPVCDSDTRRPSYDAFGDGPTLTAADMEWFWSMYDPTAVARTDPDAAPLRATSFAGLPPTSVVVAGVDPLHDEAVAFGAAAGRDGVDVRVEVVPGVMHGFMAVPSIASGRRALDRVAERLRTTLA